METVIIAQVLWSNLYYFELYSLNYFLVLPRCAPKEDKGEMSLLLETKIVFQSITYSQS